MFFERELELCVGIQLLRLALVGSRLGSPDRLDSEAVCEPVEGNQPGPGEVTKPNERSSRNCRCESFNESVERFKLLERIKAPCRGGQGPHALSANEHGGCGKRIRGFELTRVSESSQITKKDKPTQMRHVAGLKSFHQFLL